MTAGAPASISPSRIASQPRKLQGEGECQPDHPAHLAGFVQCGIGKCAPARLILAGLMVAQLADAATFVLGVGMHRIGLESNGFAVALHQVGGTDAVLIAKGAVVVSAVVLLAATAHRFPRLLVLGSAS
jgi:hypothetical protein